MSSKTGRRRRGAESTSSVSGPFFVLRNVVFSQCSLGGESTDTDFTVAWAFSGEHQVELVQQHNAAPSVYTEFIERSSYGPQHSGVLSTDLDLALDQHECWDRHIHWSNTAAGQRRGDVDVVFAAGMFSR
jgi:hypothetical protein